MNRNTNTHFALNPTRIDMSRSTFDRNSSVKTSFNVGDIVPFYVDEVLPGDTFDIDTSKVIRMPSLLTQLWTICILIPIISLFPIELFGNIGKSLWERITKVLGYPPQSTKSRRLRLLLVVGISVLLLIIWVYLLVLVVSLSTLFLLEHTL